MDATRTNPDYLYRMLEEVIKVGATTINIADTVGYAIPSDFQAMLRDIQRNVPGIDGVTLSVSLPQRPGPGGVKQPGCH